MRLIRFWKSMICPVQKETYKLKDVTYKTKSDQAWNNPMPPSSSEHFTNLEVKAPEMEELMILTLLRQFHFPRD